MLLALLIGGAAQAQSVRILTFNVKFLPDGSDVSDSVFPDDAARAQYLADELVAQLPTIDADVIVFNEVMNEEARDIFAAELCASHPYHTDYVDEPGDGGQQDAGLMLFSRIPFAPQDLIDDDYEWTEHHSFSGCVDDDADQDDPLWWEDLGFVLYPLAACSGWDCEANKGAAVLSFQPSGQSGFSVVFTHMQADVEDAAERQLQLDEIQGLIESIPSWSTRRIFVVGDLNIDGLGCSGAGCTGLTDTSEWLDTFGNSSSFFGCGNGTINKTCVGPGWLSDAHGFSMPATDTGRTYHGVFTSALTPDEGGRLDYALHTRPSQMTVCSQQVRVLRNLVLDAFGTPLSDHDPVLFDFNANGVYCSPTQAPAVPTPLYVHDGWIGNLKGLQWLKIAEEGTYSLTSTSTTSFQVYTADDLSYPIAPDGVDRVGRKFMYRLNDPPYYVRASGPPTFLGAYQLTVEQHDCGASAKCGLTPGDGAGVWASWDGSAVVADPSRWFWFDTDVGDTGISPTLTFHVDGVCGSTFEAILRNLAGTVIPWTTVTPGLVGTDLTATVNTLPKGRYTLEIHRTDNATGPLCTVNVNYATTLTWFTPLELVCSDETGEAEGEWGHDEIWYRLAIDTGCVASTDEDDYYWLYDFDEDDAKSTSASDMGVHRIARCWQLDLLEEDDISSGAVMFLHESPHGDGLDPWLTELLDEKVVSETLPQQSYTYNFRYRMTHEQNPH